MYSRCFSYGPKGRYIARSAIQSLIPPDEVLLSTFSPLTYNLALEFVIVPQVLARLISQDLEIRLVEAFKIMNKSAEVGKAINCLEDDDEEFEDISMANVKAYVRRCQNKTINPNNVRIFELFYFGHSY
jgi:hypothetical protein